MNSIPLWAHLLPKPKLKQCVAILCLYENYRKMVASTSSFELTREDGTKLTIEIAPVFYEAEGKEVPAGVYELLATPYNDQAGESIDDNPLDRTAIGSFAHQIEDRHEWVYVGDFLTDEEQERVAAHIQNLDNNG